MADTTAPDTPNALSVAVAWPGLTIADRVAGGPVVSFTYTATEDVHESALVCTATLHDYWGVPAIDPVVWNGDPWDRPVTHAFPQALLAAGQYCVVVALSDAEGNEAPSSRSATFAIRGPIFVPPSAPDTIAACATASVQRVASRCTAYLGGSQVAVLDLTGGSVTADARRSQMRDATMQFAPSGDLSLEDVYDMLVTPGLQLQVERGFVLADGSALYAPLGCFVVDAPTLKSDVAGQELSVTCSDLSARISRARWTDPFAIASGTALADAINAVLADRWPSVTSAVSAESTPGTIASGGVLAAGSETDPWSDVLGLAGDHGFVLYFDVIGVARTKPAPTLDPALSVFTFSAGEAAVVTEQTRVAALALTYNGVIVTGEAAELDDPVRGEAWDVNPGSRTYYLGPFGRVPKFYTSPFITEAAQAQAVAFSMLTGVLGRVEQLSWSFVVHPGLMPLDVVLVERAAACTPYILDAITIPLSASDAAQAVAREVRVQT
jgi:hypothetical protein